MTLLRKANEQKKLLSEKQTQLFDVFIRPFCQTERGASNEASVKEKFDVNATNGCQDVGVFFSFFFFWSSVSGNTEQKFTEINEKKNVISGQSHLHFVSLI